MRRFTEKLRVSLEFSQDGEMWLRAKPGLEEEDDGENLRTGDDERCYSTSELPHIHFLHS